MRLPASLSRLGSRLGGFVVSQALTGSQRLLDIQIAHYDSSADPAHPDFHEPCIWVFWHEYIWAAVSLWQHCDVTMLISRHRDGGWLNEAGKFLKFQTVRGSTQRGGAEALRELKRLSGTSGIGITPDGPRGPRRSMALGPVYLASRLGVPIVPTGFGFERPYRMNTWDRFALPRPLGRARAVMGKKIFVPDRLDKDELELARLQIEDQINQVTATAEDWAAQGYELAGAGVFKRRPNRSWRNQLFAKPRGTRKKQVCQEPTDSVPARQKSAA
jgi:lysophospholipid acyltransferase (LPLAT)-like uncharacterized protein